MRKGSAERVTMTSEETHRFIFAEQAKYAAIVKSVGITPG